MPRPLRARRAIFSLPVPARAGAGLPACALSGLAAPSLSFRRSAAAVLDPASPGAA